MKNVILIFACSLVLGSCAFNGHHSFENHYVSMNDKIDDEHVKFENGLLFIDNKKIELPGGSQLSISYKNENDTVNYSVEVDGKMVALVKNTNED